MNPHNIYHDYILLNKDLQPPHYYKLRCLSEHDRIIMTKYRSGSHNLAIQTGRQSGVERNERLCRCGQIQTLPHIILHCDLTKSVRRITYPKDLYTFFNNDPSESAKYLREIEDILNLK